MKIKHRQAGEALIVQQHQTTSVQRKIGEIADGVGQLEQNKNRNRQTAESLEADLDALLAEHDIETVSGGPISDGEIAETLALDETAIDASACEIGLLDVIDSSEASDWETYRESIRNYAAAHGIDLGADPFDALMTESQRSAVAQRIEEDLSFRNPQCDRYDYALAAACGLVGGVIDVTFVGAPGTGSLGELSDQAVDGAVEKLTTTIATAAMSITLFG
jgi:hypothetical protein